MADRIGEIADRASVVALAVEGLSLARWEATAVATAAYEIADNLRAMAAEISPEPEAVKPGE